MLKINIDQPDDNIINVTVKTTKLVNQPISRAKLI